MFNFNVKMGGEDIFNRIIRNECLKQNSNGNGVIIIDFATSKIVVVKSTIFSHLKHS